MNKKMIREVVVSSSCFLVLIWLAFSWVQTYFPMPKSTVVSKAENKVMYLTFDDGPSKLTQEIIDILDTYQIKATFFVTGSNPAYYDKIKLASEKGHGIAIHTFSHNYKEIYASEEAYFKDLEKMNAVIKKQIGKDVKVLRFPGGSSNTVSKKYQNKIMSVLTKSVLAKGYQYYDWNASNGDGNSNLDKQTLIRTAKEECKGKDEVMMLMHDGTGNKATVEALPTILENLLEQGYAFKLIDESTASAFHHHVAN